MISSRFLNYVDSSSTPLENSDFYSISTDKTASNGLFKTTLIITTTGIKAAKAGMYRCLFSLSESETYHSEGRLKIGLVTINPSDPNIYSYSNAGVELSCTLETSGSISEITWTGPDGVIDSSLYSKDSNNPNLYIVSLPSSASNGEYRCTFTLTEEYSTTPQGIFSNVNINRLKMMTPDHIYSTHGEGVSVTLTCQVSSPDQLELYFHDGSQEIQPTSIAYIGESTVAEYVITIDSANKGGTFQCRKSESETSPSSTTLTVFSISPPLATPTRANTGVTITLTCTAQFHPDIHPPTLSWRHSGKPASETAEDPVVSEEQSSTVTSKLPVVVSSGNDGSVYKCVAIYTGLAAGSRLESSTLVIMNS